MNRYEIVNLDYYLEDEMYQSEVESKGCLLNVEIKVDDKIYILSFYDTVRFQQDINEELKNQNYYNLSIEEDNIIFLKKITLENILNSIQNIFKNGEYKNMRAKVEFNSL